MGGLLIAEIQQNSNTTYRVYDWNRVGDDDNPRSLHVDKALDVINFDQVEPTIHPPKTIANENGVERQVLCNNQYFVTERVIMEAGSKFDGECDGRTLEIWGVLDGEAQVNEEMVSAVQFILLPAALGPFSVTAKGDCVLLRSFVDG
jgi:mannose-6-phosphate isomerase